MTPTSELNGVDNSCSCASGLPRERRSVDGVVDHFDSLVNNDRGACSESGSWIGGDVVLRESESVHLDQLTIEMIGRKHALVIPHRVRDLALLRRESSLPRPEEEVLQRWSVSCNAIRRKKGPTRRESM